MTSGSQVEAEPGGISGYNARNIDEHGEHIVFWGAVERGKLQQLRKSLLLALFVWFRVLVKMYPLTNQPSQHAQHLLCLWGGELKLSPEESQAQM